MDRKTIIFITLHAVSAAAAVLLAALAIAGLAGPGSTAAMMLAAAVLVPQAALLLMAFMPERKCCGRVPRPSCITSSPDKEDTQ